VTDELFGTDDGPGGGDEGGGRGGPGPGFLGDVDGGPDTAPAPGDGGGGDHDLGGWGHGPTLQTDVTAFPSFPSRSITIRRRALFSTKIQTATSGRELRASWQSRPRHEYQITFEALVTGRLGRTQPQALFEFYARMRGAFGTFSFRDPLDGQTRTCRFAEDGLEMERFSLHHWKTAGIKIVEVFQ
jgi:hypothetical protein